MLNSVLITIYNDPEKYPPTLNTAFLLLEHVKNVILLGRGLQKSRYQYPVNIKSIRLNDDINYRELVNISRARKFTLFLRYIFELRRNLKKHKPEIVICHDMMAAFAYWLIHVFSIKKQKRIIWYHNHDVIHSETLSKFSVMWLGKLFEDRVFNAIDVFTLPVEERKQYFPLDKFQGKVSVIPNYPRLGSFQFSNQHRKLPADKGLVKLVYQGSLGDNHGFSSFIKVLNSQVKGYVFHLTLIGNIRPDYKARLLKEAKESGVEDKLEILAPIPFSELFEFSRGFHIGIATHIPGEKAIYKYGATSSNKIYEYAAVGLPVILYDTPHYTDYLEKYRWTSFVDLTPKSIVKALLTILNDYEEMSKAAIIDISKYLNYEKVFTEAYGQLIDPGQNEKID